ncbi:unnamed protein product [Tilletia controversa]|uniref:Dynein intermediate chain, cytosolic n=3 Tax=Tilletia TaxID=13289 RepID=A0A8X7N0H7_9BASI|nr:hypothetical protein CF336_g69 [Tilletia laevis]KAE8205250.1 hypothetical protein CF328_g606 [Tilletia controversa]KAE8265783.1 hypothetical protein A4X03_0g34 [Tilletia caries]KAE8208945.1 hypothetical protein CF335_g43 [Tilletia laevis]KAE8254133.1 hypothetical protein A4X06_0g1050 [Tilletia controversa]
MSTSEASKSQRRAEISAKRAKLEELRKVRAERGSGIASSSRTTENHIGGRLSDSRGGSSDIQPFFSSIASKKGEIDSIISSSITRGIDTPGGASTGSGRRSSYLGGQHDFQVSPRKSGTGAGSEHGGSEGASLGTTMINRADGEIVDQLQLRDLPDMIDVHQPLFEYPQTERVFYTKEVQTTSLHDDDDDDLPLAESFRANGVTAQQPVIDEEAIRAKILAEQAAELEARREEERLEKEIEEELRQLTAEELRGIYGATEFTDFVEHSSKIVERALADSYDFLKDYTVAGLGAEGDDLQHRQLKLVRTFWDDKILRNRSVTDLDWSTKHPELSVASYNRNEMSSSDPGGIVAVWNLHSLDRPEFVFHAQTDVLSVCFSPFHPNLVCGGTHSGQVLIWDTRARALPVLKSPLSASGHTHPVYSMQMVGTQNAHNLVTASTDGTVCFWMLDMLTRPLETFTLVSGQGRDALEVSVTTMGFSDQDTTNFLVGTEEGNVYSAVRFDRGGIKAGINPTEVYRGHAAPITGMHFHPLVGPVDFSDLYLTSSMDWTTRLWRARIDTGAPSAPPPGATSGGVTGGKGPGANDSSSSREAQQLQKLTQQSSALNPGGVSGSAAGGASTVYEPVLAFEESSEYVYDVKWHTHHPALFGQVDGNGRFDVYNLNYDVERPILSTVPGASNDGRTPARALNKLAWDRKDGRRCALGSADGRVYVYELAESLAVPTEDEFVKFQSTVGRLLKGGQSAGSMDVLDGRGGVGGSLGGPGNDGDGGGFGSYGSR